MEQRATDYKKYIKCCYGTIIYLTVFDSIIIHETTNIVRNNIDLLIFRIVILYFYKFTNFNLPTVQLLREVDPSRDTMYIGQCSHSSPTLYWLAGHMMKHSLFAEITPCLYCFVSPLILFLSQQEPVVSSNVKALHLSCSIHFNQQSSKTSL